MRLRAAHEVGTDAPLRVESSRAAGSLTSSIAPIKPRPRTWPTIGPPSILQAGLQARRDALHVADDVFALVHRSVCATAQASGWPLYV